MMKYDSLRVLLTRCWRAAVAGMAMLMRRPMAGFAASIARNGRVWIAVALGLGAVALVSMPLFDVAAITGARKLSRFWIVEPFDFYTDFGRSSWLLIPVAILWAVLALLPPAWLTRMSQGVVAALQLRLAFVFIAIGLPSLFGTIVKRMIGRARPFVGGGPDPYLYSLFAFDVRYASLPSGHATTAFAAALAISAAWPQTRYFMWTYAVLIGISRVVVGAHHPSDVVAGAMVGILGAMLVRQWFAARRLVFTIAPDGKIARRPGPGLARVLATLEALAGAARRAYQAGR